jgi:hypothetical protein
MFSNIRLAQMHLRLQEIFSNHSLFAGHNLLFFGDLLQVYCIENILKYQNTKIIFYKKLPPVLADFCFMPISAKDKKKVFGSIPLTYNFWETFQFKELTENCRQKNDTHFAELLKRVRIGVPTVPDIELLESKCIDNYKNNKQPINNAAKWFCEKVKEKPNLLALFP